MSGIHPSAIVSPSAKLASDVVVGPLAVIEDDVEVGAGSTIESHAVLKSGTRIGKLVTIGNHAVIAGLPQDLSFDASVSTFVEIGDGSTIREGVTVNRATREGAATVVGEKCYFMAQSHVGHDCHVGNGVILANDVLLAGHVSMGDNTFVGGGAGIHQFCRVGEGVMLGGHAAVSMDIAPFTTSAERNTLFGLNLVGLKRRGADKETIRALQAVFKQVFNGPGNVRKKAEQASQGEFSAIPEVARFLAFFEGGKKGFASPGRSS